MKRIIISILVSSFVFSGCFATHTSNIRGKAPSATKIALLKKLDCNHLRAELEFTEEEYSSLSWEQNSRTRLGQGAQVFAAFTLGLTAIFSARFDIEEDVNQYAKLKGERKIMKKFQTEKDCVYNHDLR